VLEQVHCAAAPIRNRDGALAAVLDCRSKASPSPSTPSPSFACSRPRSRTASSPPGVGAPVAALPACNGDAGTPLEGLAVIDGRGEVTWVNGAVRAARKPARTAGRAQRRKPVRDRARAAAPTRGAVVPQPHRLPSGLGVWWVVSDPGRRCARCSAPSLLDVNRRHIEQTLVACRGTSRPRARSASRAGCSTAGCANGATPTGRRRPEFT